MEIASGVICQVVSLLHAVAKTTRSPLIPRPPTPDIDPVYNILPEAVQQSLNCTRKKFGDSWVSDGF